MGDGLTLRGYAGFGWGKLCDDCNLTPLSESVKMLGRSLGNPESIVSVVFRGFAPKCVSKRIIVKICTTRKNHTNTGVTSASYSSDIDCSGQKFLCAGGW